MKKLWQDKNTGSIYYYHSGITDISKNNGGFLLTDEGRPGSWWLTKEQKLIPSIEAQFNCKLDNNWVPPVITHDSSIIEVCDSIVGKSLIEGKLNSHEKRITVELIKLRNLSLNNGEGTA